MSKMLLAERDVRWLHVENSTKCNAWCPECARNQGGFGLNPRIVVQDLSTSRFQELLEQFPNVETIQFCGTFGDTMAASNVLEHVELAKQHCQKIQIHTHGALRSKSWWGEFADIIKTHSHDVWFAIDGLEGVHELYRQGTKFAKVIENAQEFINRGGHATWQFIPWQHNEHQLKECMVLSQKMGFKKFKLVAGVRKSKNARHYKTGEPIQLIHWSKSAATNNLLLPKTKVSQSDCFHLREKSVYINATGKISHCCYYNLDRAVDQFCDLGDMEHELANNPSPKCIDWCGKD